MMGTQKDWERESWQRVGTKFTFGDIWFIRAVLDGGLGTAEELAEWYRDTPAGMRRIQARSRGVAVPEEGSMYYPNIKPLRMWAQRMFKGDMPRFGRGPSKGGLGW